MNAGTLTRRHALCAAAVGLTATSQAQTQTAQQAAFESAMADYERQHFAAAYQAFWLLADQGHAEAARIALLMAAHGPRLYGMRFAIGPVQQERWIAAGLQRNGNRAVALAR